MSQVNRLRTFLVGLPKPHTVRVSAGDSTEEIKVGKQKYIRIAESIVAMNADLVECLDKDGTVIRAKRLDDPEARRSDAAPIPEAIANDPHAAMLTHMANLLHRAYEHSTEIAFVKLVELVDRIDARSDSIEQRLERSERALQQSFRDQLDMEYERAHEIAQKAQEGDQGAIQQMASAFLQSAMQGGGIDFGPKPRPNGKANQ